MTIARCRLSRRPFLAALVVLFASAVSAAPGRNPQPPRVNADAATIADFMKRVDDYVALHQKVEGCSRSRRETGRPEAVVEHEHAFAKLMQKERPYAKRGDIVTKPMRNIVRRLLAGVFRGPQGREIKRSILDEYTGNVPLQINSEYPENTPFSSVPPQILEGLPRLPAAVLTYRFVGQRLILLDPHGRLIVDVVGSRISVRGVRTDNQFPRPAVLRMQHLCTAEPRRYYPRVA